MGVTTATSPTRMRQQMTQVAQTVARTFRGACVGGVTATETGAVCQILVPGARGQYVATITVDATPVEEETPSWAVHVDGNPHGKPSDVVHTDGEAGTAATGGYRLPGGFSQVADVGDHLKMSPTVAAGNIVEIITNFESNVPSLALSADRVGNLP